ncbi:MAG TPA: Y4yA family PLP-dependent enzyme [Tessaracoccus flavescens]|uniref:Y4yA family PLP-dependent enzyme n=1 Tax=Tessaracoccus flavescens TaxID=399497 RepID=A0A921EMP1_9ACTN|nr:Y4yA family PLP-dependent enzyme [Tessaracoccus flavescens]
MTPDVHGQPPLTGRREPWMDDLLADPAAVLGLIERFGSPVNVIEPSSLSRNAEELVTAGEEAGVTTRVFYARKANKTHALVREAIESGHGVDVASLAELSQVLDLGMPPERVIVSAAIKNDALLQLAVDRGVTVSVDHVAELSRIAGLADPERPTPVAPRLAPDPAAGVPPTRFGERSAIWLEALDGEVPGVEVVGLHVHLHGYAVADRARAIAEASQLASALRDRGHEPRFLDLGGGVPMSYLDDPDEWQAFWAALKASHGEAVTWKDHSLGTVYPYHQSPTRGEWLREVLASRPDGEATCAELLRGAGLALHLEPGRSLADGCGLTLARVAFVKLRSDGVPLVGVEMNRTQCRSTSDDFMVDPVLVRTQPEGVPYDGFLVGAYCIEDEIILRRRMHFPRGVAAGDVVALINTGGYLMHILESASHQLPLAKNVVWPAGELDGIDA